MLVMIGIGDQCSNRGMKHFTEELTEWSNSTGYCMYVNCQVNISLTNFVQLFISLEVIRCIYLGIT